MATGPSSKLPRLIHDLFWDGNVSVLRWDEDRDFIVARILSQGTWPQIRWLRSRLTDRRLRDWLIRRSGRGLSPPQLRFWELTLDLPRRRVSAWIARDRAVWGGRFHR